MGKSSPPDPIDPSKTASAQVSQNIGTSIANSYLNNVNQFGPDGSKTYDIDGYKTYWDRSDPKNPVKYRIPQYTQTTALSGMNQKIYDQTQDAKLNLAGLANQQSGFLQDYLGGKPWSYKPGQHEDWALGLYDKLNSDKETDQMQSLQTQLANSGIKLGSDAYDKAMQSQMKSQGDLRNQFALDSYKTGFQTSLTQRNQPLNQISALMSGSQVQQPQFGSTPNYTIPTTDRAGINAQYDQAKMAQWQAQAAQSGQLLGGLFSLGSAFLSDERAKEDIEKVGEMPIEDDAGKDKTVGIFDYRYKNEPDTAPKTRGVMAQELLRKNKKSAVKKTNSGLLAVYYDKLRKKG